jgi:hypothetical protein
MPTIRTGEHTPEYRYVDPKPALIEALVALSFCDGANTALPDQCAKGELAEVVGNAIAKVKEALA